MKVTVLTLGTRGDVQPYVALATGLMKKGHEVTICTGSTFKPFIESYGIDFKEATIDFMEILKTEEGQAIFNGGGNIFKILKFTKEVINPGFRKTFDDFLDACQGCDVIIYHPKAMVAPDLAEYLNIPCISMPPVPMTFPITEFPNLAVSANKSFGSVINKMTYGVNKFAESSSMKDINDFRQKTLKLNKRKMGAYTYDVKGKRIPIIYPISEILFKKVTSWKGYVSLTGFFYLPYQGQLDEGLMNFIENGQAPIVISFSSMPLKHPQAFKQYIIDALNQSNNRAVILTGISGMNFEGHDNIYAVEKAPHRLLFKHAKGIIHHGGVGTMAEALLSGKPQVIMPFNVDQPFWANRLFKQDLALKPLSEKTISTVALIDRFILMDDVKYKDNAKIVADEIAKEDGIMSAVSIIESIVGDQHA